MSDLGLPSSLIQVFTEAAARIRANARAIDGVYVQRGFASVGAQVARDARLCGPASYELFIARQLDVQLFERTKAAFQRWHAELDERERALPDSKLDELWHSSELDCSFRQTLLRRFWPDALETAFATHRAAIRSAALDERRRLCTLTGAQPAVRLHDLAQVPLRKAIVNDVCADAFGKLGFEPATRKKGVASLRKRVTTDFAIVIAPDVRSLEMRGVDQGEDYGDVAFSTLVLDWQIYLAPAKRASTKLYRFVPLFETYATALYARYVDTHSLEVCLRAKALAYELLIAPYEEAVRQ